MTNLTMMIALLIVTAAIGFWIVLGFVLQRLIDDGLSFDAKVPRLPVYPGISVVIPVKGPIKLLRSSVISLLAQDYPGELEIIYAFQDAGDPSLPELESIFETAPARIGKKILRGLPFLGLNPKNSNLVHGYREAKHPWIFFADVDTRFPPEHLRRCLTMTKADPNRYATAITVHDGAGSLPALLEVAGTNMSLFPYFTMVYRFDENASPINGASNLFSKELLERSGGIEQILDVLTDDAVLERAFRASGARGVLAPHFVRVTLQEQTWRGFVQRQFRWMMIAKAFFFPQCLITPALWVWQWLLFIGLVLHDPHLWVAGLTLLLGRQIAFWIYQTKMQVPLVDRLKGIGLILCDIIIPCLWIANLPIRRVVWAGRVLTVERGGRLRAENTDH